MDIVYDWFLMTVQVILPFGRAFLGTSSILGAEQLSAQALAAIGVTKGVRGKEDLIWNGLVTGSADASGAHANGAANSTANSTTQDRVQEPCKLFFGTQMCYVFLRLHHTLFVRLRTAYRLAQQQQQQQQQQTGAADDHAMDISEAPIAATSSAEDR